MPKKSRSTKGRRRNNRRKSTKNIKKGGHHRIKNTFHYSKCNIDGPCGYHEMTDGKKSYFRHDFPINRGQCTNGCGCSNK